MQDIGTKKEMFLTAVHIAKQKNILFSSYVRQICVSF